jgi:hypothetical protein
MHLGESNPEPLQVLPRLFTSCPDCRLSDSSDTQTNTVLFEILENGKFSETRLTPLMK